jgi:DNA-binding NtrC family response regulator
MNELILIVDDETGILTTLSQILGDEGYRTVTTTSGEEALHLFREQKPAVVFLDIWLPDWDGLETLQALRDVDPYATVIMMSGHGTSETAVKAIKMGAHDYLEKPLSYDRTVKAVKDALEAKRAKVDRAADPRDHRPQTEDDPRRERDLRPWPPLGWPHGHGDPAPATGHWHPFHHPATWYHHARPREHSRGNRPRGGEHPHR